MKKTRSLVNSLLGCGVALAMISTVAAQTTAERVATVVHVKGPARFMAPGGQWQNLAVGTTLRAGYVVQTAKDSPGSYVDLILGESEGGVGVVGAGVNVNPAFPWAGGGAHKAVVGQDTVRLLDNTALAIDKLLSTDTGAGMVTDTELDLRKGHIVGNVKKLSAGSRYEIKYPNGVAGIRGSTYDMNLVEGIMNGTVTINCQLSMSVGSAVLSYMQNGQTLTQTILPGNTFDTSTGVLSAILPTVLSFIENVLASMGVPQGVAIQAVTSSQTIVTTTSPTTGAVKSTVSTGGED